jgi:nucleoside-diphosphate-sugar epimerase
MSGTAPAQGPLVAVTGATGFLGSHVVDLLLARGCRVRVSVRATSDPRWLRDKPLEIAEVPLSPPQGVADGEEADADPALVRFLDGAVAVVHCAGVVRAPDEAGYRRGNVATTRRLRDAAVAAGCRTFVLVSSLAAAGPAAPQTPRRESDPCAPITAYGRSKLAAERLLAEDDLPLRAAILRPPALYGPRDGAFLPLFRMARRGWSIRLNGGPAALSLVDGRDAAAAAVALLETEDARGPYFVDDGRAYGFGELADALALALRRPVRCLPLPLGLLRGAARLAGRRAARLPLLHPDRLADLDVPGWVCDGGRLRRETGFRPRHDLRGGFTDTLAFYRRHGWLPAH